MKTIKNKLKHDAVGPDNDDLSRSLWKKLCVRLLVGTIIAVVSYVFYIALGGLKIEKRPNYEIGWLKTAKFSRSQDQLTQTQILRENVVVDQESVIFISACARGKFLTVYGGPPEGLVEVKVFLDDIENSHNTVYAYNCTYRNQDRTISSETTSIVEKEKGHYAIRVEAVYYGNIEMHDTTARYVVMPKYNDSWNMLNTILF